MNRRSFLKGAGALTVLVAGGGIWRACHQGVFSVERGPAFEPWRDWRSDTGEGPLSLVRAAILAANPHNTQPWLFEVTPTEIGLYAYTARNLGSFDPYLREMHIGLGCALENIALAATVEGYKPDIRLQPGQLVSIQENAEQILVSRVGLGPAARQRSELYDAIPRRHTNRGHYDPERPLPKLFLEGLSGMGDGIDDIRVILLTNETDKAGFRNAVLRATEAIVADPDMVRDSDAWFRHSWSAVQKLRDGVTLDAAGLSAWMTALAKMLPEPSTQVNHDYWLEGTRSVHLGTAPVFGLIAVRNLYDRVQNLQVGRLWQRMHLGATAQGIAMQPLNQPMEMADRDRELGRETGAARELIDLSGSATWAPTFGFRVGYPIRKAPASPRRPLEDVII